MGWQENALTADGWGVRVGDEAFPVRAFPWAAVTRLRAYTVADGGDAFAVVEIHHDGDGEEILTNWQDFPAVAAGISTHLPGVRSDWLNFVRSLSASAEPVTVWERDG